MEEIALSGGNATAGVVRIGDTVRKPWTDATPTVIEYMRSLAAQGLDIPAPLGRDEAGRQIIEFVAGPSAHTRELTPDDLRRIGGIVRAIHDASPLVGPDVGPLPEMLLPADEPDLLCHNDLTPWNLIVGDRWVFIDWDGAGPSTRLWDLAYSAQAFTLNDPDAEPSAAAAGLVAFLDGYDADAALRAALPRTMARRAWAMHDMLRRAHDEERQPWGSMYVDGHGAHWRAVAAFVEAHEGVWRAALAEERAGA